ncbi:penicillin-binding protein [Marivirga atlantica]|uniref:Transpeptidase family protein n=1 Tax=Marivirga atlantica TaxID=1548457 RepID=A0A937AJN7_9BACT|nr:penicillin-binding protein [Marivirga atlantica]MBL0766734.1 transpeptidase family protein [Marivirga atlantica]
MNIKKSILLRVRIAFLFVLIFAIAIIYQIVNIQWINGEKWKQMAEEINLSYQEVKATRGNIYSDNGSLLATSLPFYRVAIDPTIAGDNIFREGVDSLSYLLSKSFGQSATYYKQKIKSARQKGNQYLMLTRDLIGYQQKKEMESWPIFREGRLGGGVIFTKTDKRFRPFSNLAFRTIGFLNENDYGAGLEYSFNDYLAGQNGKALFQKISGGSWRPLYDGTEVRPKDGYDIQTTIDINLQDVAESALLSHLVQHDADMGCVVVMEVATGEIKAISNLKKLSSGRYGEVYNYAVGSHGLREPGSTMKLASYIALLEERDLKLSDSIKTGDGELKFYKETVRDHKPGGYGTISLQEAFEKSSNIAIAKLIDETFRENPQRFLDYLKTMGLTEPLGFQMIGEGKPKVPPLNQWSGITLPWMAYGYGLEFTPLQILTLYNAVANNGKMIRPLLVKSIRQVDREINTYKTSVISDQICSKETLKKVRTLLEGVVERGTASNINNANYKVAGKTGTAQSLKNGRYVRQYYTSFAGYFPADNPKYSAIVVMDNPKGYRQYGSDVAAPVFKEIADKIYALDLKMHDKYALEEQPEMGIFPVVQAGKKDELSLMLNFLGISNHSEVDEAEWVRADIDKNSIEWKLNEAEGNVVPNVQGMTLRDALYLLENKGLQVVIKGDGGRVITQSQLPGTKALKGSTIKIEVS